MKIRVGFGFDVHQLVEGRDLWLGGIKLEHTKGLLGHSDADVLIHAICDALLHIGDVHLKFWAFGTNCCVNITHAITFGGNNLYSAT